MPVKHSGWRRTMRRVVVIQHSGNLMACRPLLTARGNPVYYNFLLDCAHLKQEKHNRSNWIWYNLYRESPHPILYRHCWECAEEVKTKEVEK